MVRTCWYSAGISWAHNRSIGEAAAISRIVTPIVLRAFIESPIRFELDIRARLFEGRNRFHDAKNRTSLDVLQWKIDEVVFRIYTYGVGLRHEEVTDCLESRSFFAIHPNIP